MKKLECVLVGLPGSGKSSLLAALLQAWRCRTAAITVWTAGGSPSRWRLRLPEEERQLHRLRPPHGFLAVEVPASQLGLAGRRWTFSELPALVDEVSEDLLHREGLAEAMARLLVADVILHVVDAERVGKRGQLSAADAALARFGHNRSGYLLVGTKMDAPFSPQGLYLLRQFAGNPEVVPCSVVIGQGIRPIKNFLSGLA